MKKPTEKPDNLLNQYLKTVGILVNNAVMCDLTLFNTFRVLSGCEPRIANAIYYYNESFQAKKNIIERILKVISNPEIGIITDKIIKSAEVANSRRNELSHALLQTSGDNLQVVNARHQAKLPKTITVAFLDDLHRQASKAHVEGLKQFDLLCEGLKIQPEIIHTKLSLLPSP